MTEKKQLDQLRDIVRSNNLIAENTQRNAKLVERIETNREPYLAVSG